MYTICQFYSPPSPSSPISSLYTIQERPQYLHHFVLHASLDALEEAEWNSSSAYLGVIDRFNLLQVSAFVTPSRIRLLLLHDGRSDDAIRTFFKDVYELYLRVALNPFFTPAGKITSPYFHQRVKGVAKASFR